MEIALLVLLVLSIILECIIIVIGLLVGSLVVQVMEALTPKKEEVKLPQSPTDKPWYSQV